MVNITPQAVLPLGMTGYPLYRRLGGPQDRSGQVHNIFPPPGFDLRTVQPVANRYHKFTWFSYDFLPKKLLFLLIFRSLSVMKQFVLFELRTEIFNITLTYFRD